MIKHINHWLKKKIGRIRWTNMMMASDEYELPIKFTIESEGDGRYRCSKKEIPGPGPYLTWISEDVIEVHGKKHTLKHSPAYSVPLGDYVFTVL